MNNDLKLKRKIGLKTCCKLREKICVVCDFMYYGHQSKGFYFHKFKENFKDDTD